ncbi:ZmpA/ZmpB/ZmpC family metallo-endopeptidase, partial [Streptococcus saliviloxodontae]
TTESSTSATTSSDTSTTSTELTEEPPTVTSATATTELSTSATTSSDTSTTSTELTEELTTVTSATATTESRTSATTSAESTTTSTELTEEPTTVTSTTSSVASSEPTGSELTTITPISDSSMTSLSPSEDTSRDEIVAIPYQVVYEDDPTLASGLEIVTQDGVNGSKRLSYLNGALVSETVISSPVNKLIRRGTQSQTSTSIVVSESQVTSVDPKTSESTVYTSEITSVVEVTSEAQPVVRTEEQVIPYDVVYENDPSLEAGTESVVQEGINGSKTLTYVDGVLTTETILTQPIAKIIHIGTATKETVNRASLLASLGEAQTIPSSGYTSDSYSRLQAAIAQAMAVYNNDQASQADLDTVQATLSDVIRSLVPVSEVMSDSTVTSTEDTGSVSSAISSESQSSTSTSSETPSASTSSELPSSTSSDSSTSMATVNRDLLDAAIVNAESKKAEDYSPASWLVLETQLDQAKSVVADTSASQVQLDQAKEALESAMAALVVDKEKLQTLLASSQDYLAEDYSPESWTSLEAVIYQAKVILDQEDSKQFEIDRVGQELEAALSQLERVITETETKSVVRTISYQFEDGSQAADTVTQTATFSRVVKHNTVTGEGVYGAWDQASQLFQEVASPEKENYEASQTLVEALEVTADSSSLELSVTYKAKVEDVVETKTVSRKINFVHENGDQAFETLLQEVVFSRINHHNLATGTLDVGNWSEEQQTFESVQAPSLDNYELDQSVLGEEVVTPYSSNQEYTFTYHPILEERTSSKTLTRTINYVDDAGNILGEPLVEEVTFTRPEVYNKATGDIYYGNWDHETQTFAAHEVPEYSLYQTDSTIVPEQEVGPDDDSLQVTITYLPIKVESQETREVTRRVHLVDFQGNVLSDDLVQSQNFVRTVSKNLVTGETTYGDWDSDKAVLPEIVLPEIQGYEALDPKINAVELTADSSSIEQDAIYYQKSMKPSYDVSLPSKFIEIKDVDEAGLYQVDDTGLTSRVLSLTEVPTDLSHYYVTLDSDRFKKMQLAVSSITEVSRDGQSLYQISAVLPQIEASQSAGDALAHYDFYLAKQDSNLVGIKSFRQLLEAISENPAGSYVLANDLSAEDYDLSAGQTAYIQETFTGHLSGLNGGVAFAIHHLKAPLFAKLSGAEVSHLDLKSVAISSNASTVGALAQVAEKGSLISDVSVGGSIDVNYAVASYDDTLADTKDADLNLGGLVGKLSASNLDNVSFSGQIDSDTASVRYIRNGYLYYAYNNTGGLVGTISDQANVTNSRFDGSIQLGQSDYNRGGGLIGRIDSASYKSQVLSNMASGQLINQGKPTTVAGLIGVGPSATRTIKDNLSAMKVTNGYLTVASGRNSGTKAYYLVDQAQGLSNSVWDSPMTAEEAEKLLTSQSQATAQLDDSKQLLATAYDVDYSQSSDYEEKRSLAYQNMEKFLPFYNRDYLVAMANGLTDDDPLVTKVVLSVLPMVDKAVVADVSGQKEAINQIMVNYADGSMDYFAVTYKGEFDSTRVVEYELIGKSLIFTPDQLLTNYDDIVTAVLPSLSQVTYTSDTIWKALATTGDQEDAIQKLYLADRFQEVQSNLETILRNVLGTSTVYLDNQGVSDYILAHQGELLLGLSYISRWYNIDFADTNIQNLVTFHQDFFGKPIETLDWLIQVGSSGYDALNPVYNNLKTEHFVGVNSGSETLPAYLEAFRQRFAGDSTAASWFYSAAKAYIVEATSYDSQGEVIGSSSLYDKLQKRLIDSTAVAKMSQDYNNMILPLLTATKDKVYIISTMEGIQFGSIETYVDPNLAEINPDLYVANLAAFKEIVTKEATNQADYWAAWYRLASDDVKEKLKTALPTWDTFYLYGHTAWSDPYGSSSLTSVTDVFGPTGHYLSKETAKKSVEAYSDTTSVYFVQVNALSQTNQQGGSIWTHEKTHVWDAKVFLDGQTHRDGVGMETYAEGLLQSPRDNRIRNSFALNLYTDWSTSDNPYPEYNASPERFQTREDLQTYMHGVMDVLYVMDYAEAMAITKLDSTTQRSQLTKLSEVARSTNSPHMDDYFTNFTDEEWSSIELKSIADFVDNKIALSRQYRSGQLGSSNSTSFGTGYLKVDLFSPFYSLEENSKGASGGYTFRRVAYELLAYGGYDAFVDYTSGRYKTDSEAVSAIFNGSYSDLNDFKKAMFAERVSKLDQLREVSFTSGGTDYQISSYQDLQTILDDLVAKGSDNQVYQFKRDLFLAYKAMTDEFNASIFQ